MVLYSKSINWLSIVLIALILSACGISRQSVHSDRPGTDRDRSFDNRVVAGSSIVVQRLESAHREWAGTPYQLGGSTRSGIDCSAFTKVVFEEYFGHEIPRHTTEQLQTGSSVRRNFIQSGDLIFFRTSRGVLHVGIAMDSENFLHASVSSGVMISSLRENYWATRYIGTRRVL